MTSDQRQQLTDHNGPIEAEIAAVQLRFEAKDIEAKDKKALQKQLTTLQATLQQPTQIRALWDRGRPSPTYVYRRGDDTQPVRPVAPGIPTVLENKQHPFTVQPPQHASPKTGRRLALARWLTRPNHPLTARVLVNRIWQQQFGQGIVKTADNFGRLGTLPSHPELLDWLAVESVEHGWSIKHVHCLIVTSTAFRQRSAITAEHELHDLDNALLSRMQVEATRTLDLSRETPQTLAMYGIGADETDSFGRRCLLARRLIERGVRFVQLFPKGQAWDNHKAIRTSLPDICRKTDKPIAGLLRDLRQRGLLDSTLVIWGGEFGRLPTAQVAANGDNKNAGRDHGPYGFSSWMAGGGVKAGVVHGNTDEIGYAAAESRVSIQDWHATILYLLGLQHDKLFFERNRLREKLTHQFGARVVREIIA